MAQKRYITLVVHDATAGGGLGPAIRMHLDARVVFLSQGLLAMVSLMDTTLDAVSSPSKDDAARAPLLDIPLPFVRGARGMFVHQLDQLLEQFSADFPPSDAKIDAERAVIDSPDAAAADVAAYNYIMATAVNVAGTSRVKQARKLDLFSYFSVVAGFLDIPYLGRVLAGVLCGQLYAPLETLGNRRKTGTYPAEWFDIDLTLARTLRPVPFLMPGNATACTHCSTGGALGVCSSCKTALFCSAVCFERSMHGSACAQSSIGALFDFESIAAQENAPETCNFFWGLEDHGGAIGFDVTERALILNHKTFAQWSPMLVSEDVPLRFFKLVVKYMPPIDAATFKEAAEWVIYKRPMIDIAMIDALMPLTYVLPTASWADTTLHTTLSKIILGRIAHDPNYDAAAEAAMAVSVVHYCNVLDSKPMGPDARIFLYNGYKRTALAVGRFAIFTLLDQREPLADTVDFTVVPGLVRLTHARETFDYFLRTSYELTVGKLKRVASEWSTVAIKDVIELGGGKIMNRDILNHVLCTVYYPTAKPDEVDAALWLLLNMDPVVDEDALSGYMKRPREGRPADDRISFSESPLGGTIKGQERVFSRSARDIFDTANLPVAVARHVMERHPGVLAHFIRREGEHVFHRIRTVAVLEEILLTGQLDLAWFLYAAMSAGQADRVALICSALPRIRTGPVKLAQLRLDDTLLSAVKLKKIVADAGRGADEQKIIQAWLTFNKALATEKRS